jgi:hypothetical protein
MKKNILRVALVAAFALIAGYTVYTSQKSVDLSALALDNVEALANENGSDKGTLYGNSAGTRFCCCSGSNDCGAAKCANC